MNNQTKTQENVKKALAKQTLGLPLTPHEHALVTLYEQSPVQQKENKPEFVEKYLKPLVVALGGRRIGKQKQIIKKRGKAGCPIGSPLLFYGG